MPSTKRGEPGPAALSKAALLVMVLTCWAGCFRQPDVNKMRCTKDCPKGTQCVRAKPTDEFGACRSIDAGLLTDGMVQDAGSKASDGGLGGSDGNADGSPSTGAGGASGQGGASSGMGGIGASSSVATPGGTTSLGGIGGTGNLGGTAGGGTSNLGGTPNPSAGTTSAGGTTPLGGTTSLGGLLSGGVSSKGGTTSSGGITGAGGTSSLLGGTTTTVSSTVPCTPKCDGKCGGPDSCNGTCPDNCSKPQTCGGGGVANVCGCKPQCEGKCGGDDGCNGLCRDNCQAPMTCGAVSPDICGCKPQCDGKCGGSDGCDSTCPNKCPAPQVCAGNGTPNKCETPPSCTEGSGATWTMVTKSASWPTNGGSTNCGMAYDSARDRVVYYLGQIFEWNPASNEWTSRMAETQPAFTSPAFVYDSERRKILLFGGNGQAGAGNETWEWDGTAGTWTRRTPSLAPPKTLDPYMAFDPVRARMVMVTSSNGNQQATWEWDGASWSEPLPAGGGTPNTIHQLHWDSVHERILGIVAGQASPEVWQWNPTNRTWTRLSFGCGPSSRSGEAVAYLPGRDQMVVFGGSEGSSLQDLWAWAPDGSSWRQYTQTSPWPGPHSGASFAYDSTRQRLVLFHGYGTSGFLDELWLLSFSP